MAYAALIGDIISSKEIPSDQRRSLQHRLQAHLRRLNADLTDSLEVDLQITGGDEIQGLFHRAPAIVDVYLEVWESLEDVRFVYGVGFGRVTTDLSERIVEIDGPCFHRAREAMETAKKSRRPLEAKGVPASEAVSTIFQLLDRIRESWTPTQRAYVSALRRLSSRKAVAQEFDVSPSAVTQALKRADYALFEDGEDAARELLEALLTHRELKDEVENLA